MSLSFKSFCTVLTLVLSNFFIVVWFVAVSFSLTYWDVFPTGTLMLLASSSPSWVLQS